MIFIMFNSCKKWIDPDMNKSPNNPYNATLSSLLPGTQAGLAYVYGGDLSYYAMLWMQHLAGGARQLLANDQYNIGASDVDNAWLPEMYVGPMKDIYNIINKATTENSPYYRGIAEVEMAIAIGAITDLWGDAPYSEAFKGETNTTPKFDKQSDIYIAINKLLDQAISDFAASKSLYSPTSDDFIYKGIYNPYFFDNWTKAAYALKARFAIHLSKVDPNAYSNALNAIAKGFISNDDDLTFNFGNITSNSNPFYQFTQLDDYGDIQPDSAFIANLINTKDPRLYVYFDTLYTYGSVYGVANGEGGGASCNFGSYFVSPTSPVTFISFVEQKFIEAEARFQTGDKAGAASAYNDALKASLAKYNITDTAFIHKNANESAGSISIQKIMTQKYYSLFKQLEVFNDWRRTGYPKLTPALFNVTNNVIPRRYPYPTSEINYNPHCPSNIPITTPVWWDGGSKK